MHLSATAMVGARQTEGRLRERRHTRDGVRWASQDWAPLPSARALVEADSPGSVQRAAAGRQARGDADGGLTHRFAKFTPLIDQAAGRRWADMLVAEQRTLQTLREVGFEVARSELLDRGGRRSLVLDRFDRRGATPDPPTAQDGFAYLSLQELATRISHRSTGKMLGDSAGYEVMMRVAADENLHQLFYRDLAKAALEADPDGMMVAIERQVTGFTMPGTGIPDFGRHAAAIARAGIYDLSIHHEQILVPVVLRHWEVDTVTGLGPDGQAAQERLMNYLAKSERVAKRLAERRNSDQLSAV